MSKKFTCFFPTNLNEQGWLNDFVLPQARIPNHDLQKFLFSDGGLPEGAHFGRDNKVFSIHPRYKNALETELRRRLDASPSDKKKAREEKEKYINFMLNISSAQVAAMSPFISLYIVRKKFGRWDWQNKEPVRFKYTTDVNFITENADNYARGDGVGILNADITRRQPRFVVDNWEISINYYFSSMAAFARKTNGMGPGAFTPQEKAAGVKYEYINTIVEKLDEEKERLILEYGWNFNDEIEDELIPKDIKQLLKKQEVKRLWISWKGHSFEFTDRGEINLNVQYVGGSAGDMFYTDTPAIVPKNKFLLSSFISKEEAKKIKELQLLYEMRKSLEEALDKLKRKREARPGGAQPIECNEAKKKEIERKVLDMKSSTADLNKVNKHIRQMEASMAASLSDAILSTIYNNRAMFNISVWSSKPGADDDKFDTQIEIFNSFNEDIESSESIYRSFLSAAARVEPKSLKPQIEEASWRNIVDVCKQEYEVTYEIKKTQPPPKGDVEKQFQKLVRGVAHRNPGPSKGRSSDPDGDHAWKFNFFPLRALVQAIYDLAGSGANHWPIVCFGNTIFRSLGEEVWTNIGDILITAETFQKWLYKLIYRDRKLNLPIGDLLHEITINLANEALYHNATGGGVSNFNLGTIRWDHYMIEPGSGVAFDEADHKQALWNLYYAKHFFGAVPAKNATIEKDALDVLLGEIKSSEETGATGKPMILVHFVPNEYGKRSSFLGSTSLVKNMFDRTNDHDLGLYHLYIGAARGLLQGISFSHKDNAKYRTALALQDRDSMAGYFKYTYSASARLIGNNVFPNAGLFVIPRNTLGLNEIEEPGIAGYYAIHETKDSIGPGKYTTEVSGINFYSEKSKSHQALTTEKESKIEAFHTPQLAEHMAEVLLKSSYAGTHKLKIEEKRKKR